MKTSIIIATIALLTGCGTPNPYNDTPGKHVARQLVRAMTETTYYDPYLGYARDNRVEAAIFGQGTPISVDYHTR